MPEETGSMNAFAYQAQTDEGHPISGTIDAPDVEQAGRLLTNLRLRVLELTPMQRVARAKPLRGDDFLAFNQQLAHLTDAGLPVERGLRLIAEDMRSKRLGKAIRTVADELDRGTPLGEAFDQFQGVFPPLYGKLVTAGIRSNNLSGMLLNLGQHLDLIARLRSMLWRVLAYPIIVIFAMAVVLAFLGIAVIPQFDVLFRGFHVQLPRFTEVVLGVAKWLPVAAIIVAVIVVTLPLIWSVLRLIGADRVAVDRVLVPQPLIGAVIRWNLIARWCDAVRLGVDAHMDLPGAIAMACEAIGSPAIERDSRRLIETLQAGRRMDEVHGVELLPTTLIVAISHSSEQHDLAGMLGNLSEMYQEHAEMRLEALPSVLTPLFIMFIAIVIGFVILGLFLPFLTLIRSLTGM